jgi:ABC-type ATPase with predicted acetyltransferase domain
MVRVSGAVGRAGLAATERVAAVAAMFGIDADAGGEEVLFPPAEVELRRGDVVLVTGPSGAGKSTFLRSLAAGLLGEGRRVVRLEEIDAPAGRAAVDCLACPLPEALAHLGRAGLSEARLLVRAPAAFSEGQRFRFRLAAFFASDVEVLIADEFGATLDRLTARAVAWQVGKFARASGKIVVAATTHEDLEEDLRPTVRVWKGLEAGIVIERVGGGQ